MMKILVFGASIIAAATASTGAGAQSWDPSIPYDNPDPVTTDFARQRGPCKDPWVTIALERVYGQGNFVSSQCETTLYNRGSWNNYNQLVHAVGVASIRQALPSGISLAHGVLNGVTTIFLMEGNKMVAAGGGNLQGHGASNMVAAGGGNILGSNGAGMVAAGGGNALPTVTYTNAVPTRSLQNQRIYKVPRSRAGLVVK